MSARPTKNSQAKATKLTRPLTPNEVLKVQRVNHDVLMRRDAIAREREKSSEIAASVKSSVEETARQYAAQRKADTDAFAQQSHQSAESIERARRWGVWIACGCDKRHREAADQGYEWTEEQVECAPKLRLAYDRGGLAFLLGPIGNGKTQLAVEMLRWATIRLGADGRYTRFADLIANLKQAAYSEGENEHALLKRLRAIKLMVIDELGEARLTPDEQMWLNRVLDHRYGEKNATILIANLDRKGLAERLDVRVIDRAHEGGCVIELKGESLRRQQAGVLPLSLARTAAAEKGTK